MQYVKCTKKLPGQLSPDRKQESVPAVDPILVHAKKDLVADIKLTKAHGSTLTPRQGSTKDWKTQTKEDYVPRNDGADLPNKKLQQDRTNMMRESAYLPLSERTAIPFSQPDADVHSRQAFPKYNPKFYHPERMDRVAAHPSRSNVVLDADKDAKEDVKLRSTSTMHEQFVQPKIEIVGKLKSKDQRGENQQELMRSNWSYGNPDDGTELTKGTRSLAHAQSVAKQPLPTRDDKLLARLPTNLKPDEVQLPENTFLDGQSGKAAKFFSRVPFQSGCNLASSTHTPSLLDRPGAGTTTQASYPRYQMQPGQQKTAATNKAGGENVGQAITLANGKKQYIPSSVRIGDFEPTAYVTSQQSQFRGVWFDDENKKKNVVTKKP